MRPSVFKSKIEAVLHHIAFIKRELQYVEEELDDLCSEGGFYVSKEITLKQFKKAE